MASSVFSGASTYARRVGRKPPSSGAKRRGPPTIDTPRVALGVTVFLGGAFGALTAYLSKPVSLWAVCLCLGVAVIGVILLLTARRPEPPPQLPTVDDILRASMAAQQSPKVTGKPVRLDDAPPLVAGREDLLVKLHTQLSAGDGPWPRIVVLCGLGGMGKTTVAVEYAHRHLAEVGLAWQFSADDPTVLAGGFGQLAAQLGVRDVLDLQDPVASVHGVLADPIEASGGAAFPAGWLLVFDNAPDQASVERFLPPAGRGRVLITSQNPKDWPHGRALEVPVLDPAAAAEFLIERTGDPDREAAEDLAAELGRLPLALEQAAAYIVGTPGTSLPSYLRLYRQRRSDLLRRGQPTGYSGTVMTTWALAFDRLQRTKPGAVGLLRLLAFCAPEAIPLRLLLPDRRTYIRQVRQVGWRVRRALIRRRVIRVLAPLINDPLAVSDAEGELRGYSLVTPAEDGSVSVHRLVQAVTEDQMPARLARQWRQATAAVIEAAIPRDPAQRDTWPEFAALLPHAQAALPADSKGLQRIAAYLEYSSNYLVAREFFRWFPGELTSPRPQDRSTLAARHNFAVWTGQGGDAAAARDLLAALLPVMERVLPRDDPDTLTARGSLAHWTEEAGDAAAARDRGRDAELLPMRERVLGPDTPATPATLTIRHNLATWTGQAGDAAAARDQLAELLPICERVLGPEHPDTLTIRHNLATWTGQAGDAAAARAQLAELLPICERVLGPEHPDTLTIRHNLATWTGQAGDAAAARAQLAELLPIQERVLGPEHPDTLTTRGNLAQLTGQAGDAAAARDQLAELLPIQERVLGPEHPDTLTTRRNLATWTAEAASSAGLDGE